LPALPAELSALVPKSEPSQTTVTAVEADFVSDYPSLKSSSGLDVLNVPLQADTTIRWTTSLQHPVTPG
jgi:hypothetical protein